MQEIQQDSDQPERLTIKPAPALSEEELLQAGQKRRGGRFGDQETRGARRLISAGVLLVGLGLWQLATMRHIFSPIALPAPLTVLQNLQTLVTVGFTNQTLFSDMWASTQLILYGFLAAVVIGVPVGTLMAMNEFLFQIIDPFLQFIRPVPPLAYMPLLVMWMGINEEPKIVLILVGTLPVIIISTVSGVRNTPVQRIRVARCLGASPLQLFWYTILPSALPDIFTGMRVGIGVAWTCLVAAELIAADVGLGWLVQVASQDLQVGIVFVGIIAIGVLGYAMELLIRLFERLAVPWRGHA